MNKIKGFTLLEILVSLVLLTIGIIGVLTLFPFGIKIQNSAKMESCASRLAQEKIEEIIFDSYGEPSFETEDYGEIPDFPLYKRVSSVDIYDPGLSSTTSEETGIKKARVEVFWKSPLMFFQKNIAFETLILKRR